MCLLTTAVVFSLTVIQFVHFVRTVAILGLVHSFKWVCCGFDATVLELVSSLNGNLKNIHLFILMFAYAIVESLYA
jgi:hypothetical protein